MTSTTRQLSPHPGDDTGWAVFLPVNGAAFVGNADPGVDWLCVGCGQILLGSVHERQFLEVLVVCPSCGAHNGSPLRNAGEPVPGRSLLIPPGRYLLGSTVDVIDKPVMAAGEAAITAYVRETGARYGDWSGAREVEIGDEMSPESLRSLVRRAIDILGDRYDSLDRSDRRGLASTTPPRRRHRLIEMIRYAEEAASALETHNPESVIELDGNVQAEFYTAMSLLDRWRYHPAWPRLARSLVSPEEVRHTIMTLSIASYLVDAGNGVGIVNDDRAASRIPDIWVAATMVERLELEVKTPQAHWSPGVLPTASEMALLMERQLDRAGSAARGQIDPKHSGVIGIGAFHLGPGGLELLEAAARRVLDREGDRKQHIAAVVLFELSYQTTRVVDPAGTELQTTFTPVMRNVFVPHPRYRGGLQISQSRPWVPWPAPRSSP